MVAKKAPGKAPPSPEQETDTPVSKVTYSVLVHTDEGVEVFEPIAAESGDEAARIALEKKGDAGASVRGVSPYEEKSE